MIKVRLKEVLADQERSLYWLWKETGVRYATLLQMNTGTVARLTIDTLERICEALQCQPGDLLMRVENRKARKR